jgi:FdhD protein
MLKEVHTIRIESEKGVALPSRIVVEFPLTIILNDEQLVTLLCSPSDLEALAVGFLLSEGLIGGGEDIEELLLDEKRGIVRVRTRERLDPARRLFMKRVLTTGCGSGLTFYSFADVDLKKSRITSDLTVSVREIMSLNDRFQVHSEIYRDTHGVHSAALCDRENMLVFTEDIGRHNAVDKIFGRCAREEIPLGNRIVIISGRISSEILFKVARRNIPVLVSKSVPTDMGVALARDFDMTLVGFARGKRMQIYAGEERIYGYEREQGSQSLPD